MSKIHKAVLKYKIGTQFIDLPVNSHILLADYQTYSRQLCLWYTTDSNQTKLETRVFVIAVTSNEDIDLTNTEHLGTVMLNNGETVLHVFEKLL